MSEKKIRFRLMLIALFCAVVTLFSLALGRYQIGPVTILKAVAGRLSGTNQVAEQVQTVLFRVRFPRVLLGLLAGGGLSLSGAVYQGIFRNPMVSPDILGASWGACFGAALGLLIGLPYLGVNITGFGFGILAVALVCLIAGKARNNVKLGMILAGIMIGSVFSSAVSFIKLVADPLNTLPLITYWLMGSLASAKNSDVLLVAPVILAGMLPIILLRWQINVMSLGEEEAAAMGVSVGKIRLILILCATLITAAVVSISGMIGWVGLVIPHLTRMLLGNDYRYVVPGTILLGGAYMVLVDDFARMLTTSEIPLGILTAFIGAPFFLYLIIKEGKKV